ncbi:MarR family winged helix-turn-helix transcriptional regulator [Antribacter gilvus]|uniref:MarR family winged helix-turn-helix transcriptional regulator n=1 Tax=Antribacter gilvus TaxID=2304675 RepID=UPI000F77A494|nr:MarR family winged helix-turn-helix transcriptional regulator [Antribacter gilvus]
MTNEDEVRWLDADQQDIWRSYLEGTARFVEALESIHAAELPLSLGEYGLLVKLSEQPDRTLRMSALADGLVVSRSRLSHTVARMEERGLVYRCAASGDRRGVNCRLTDAGYAALVDAAPGHVRAVRRLMVDVLEPEEFEVLGRVMAKVAAAGRAATEATGTPKGRTDC